MRYFRALLALLLLVVATPAWAHTNIVSVSPDRDEVLTTAPTQVVIATDDVVQDMGTAITVTSPSGVRVDDGSTEVQGKSVLVGLATLTEVGTYTVNYRLLAQDGHALDGSYTFTIGGSSDDPSVTESPKPAATGSSTNQLPAFALALVAISSLLLLIRRLRR